MSIAEAPLEDFADADFASRAGSKRPRPARAPLEDFADADFADADFADGDFADEVVPQGATVVRVIRSTKRHKTASARMSDGVLEVRVPAWMTDDEEAGLVSKVVARWEEAKRCGHLPLEPRAKELAARFGLPEPRSIRWSSRQRHRWGSCTPGNADIRISTRLADAPPWVLDHVIVHELAHLMVPDHSPEFHAIVNRNPNAERAEGYLLALTDLGRSPAASNGSLVG
ncbi:MAG: M48 family metallopeptidase [Acidimicrobiaceae bacterium]|nr:M48 family metallopeptidase [Acidimicrobiaceae bacterium]